MFGIFDGPLGFSLDGFANVVACRKESMGLSFFDVVFLPQPTYMKVHKGIVIMSVRYSFRVSATGKYPSTYFDDIVKIIVQDGHVSAIEWSISKGEEMDRLFLP